MEGTDVEVIGVWATICAFASRLCPHFEPVVHVGSMSVPAANETLSRCSVRERILEQRIVQAALVRKLVRVIETARQ